MKNKCEYCGKDLKPEADVCLHCGKLINKDKKNEEIESKNIEEQSVKERQKEKIPGNGKSIAGMILGIVSSTWVFFEILSLGIVSFVLNELLYYNYYASAAIIKISFAIGYTLFSLVPSLVGLPLSISGFTKRKTGKNTAGIILNVIALIISILIYVYIMLFA